MSIDSYLVGRTPLTEEEEVVLGRIKQAGKPIGEHEFHIVVSVAPHILGNIVYQFEPKAWEQIDERYKTGYDCLPYCEKLHGVIESLVAKRYLIRGSEDPIVISEDKQLNLF